MKNEQDKRRSFLKHIMAGTAVVLGSVTAIKSAKAKSSSMKKKDSGEVLYHESEDFKKYYDSLR